MATLYFLGGEHVWKRDSKEINARAFLDAGGKPAVLVFPWARSSFDKSYFQRARIFKYFKSLGASTVDFAEYSDPSSELVEKVEFSDLIYLTGGLTSVLLERIRNKNVDTLLREYGKVIVGRSAGALVLCNRCIITRNRERPATVAISGIRLVDFSIKVHYNPSKDNQLKLLSKEEKIYAIPEGSALVYAGGSLASIGNVYLFQNGEKTRAD